MKFSSSLLITILGFTIAQGALIPRGYGNEVAPPSPPKVGEYTGVTPPSPPKDSGYTGVTPPSPPKDNEYTDYPSGGNTGDYQGGEGGHEDDKFYERECGKTNIGKKSKVIQRLCAVRDRVKNKLDDKRSKKHNKKHSKKHSRKVKN